MDQYHVCPNCDKWTKGKKTDLCEFCRSTFDAVCFRLFEFIVAAMIIATGLHLAFDWFPALWGWIGKW